MSEQGSFESPVIRVESEDHHQTVVSMASIIPGGGSQHLASVTEMMRNYSLRNSEGKNGGDLLTSTSSSSIHHHAVHVSYRRRGGDIESFSREGPPAKSL